ncbi:MAG: elongation factor Ts [Hyphomicrobiaceae bacterium]|nr:elongation factor Ts [Hyphomicrobiaceae bacterium]MCC0023490.1 elongation factor Ts [Hyphomicrobiaceae bacterium]
MTITAAMVKELREVTGVGMMDCKNALNATEGDMEAAIDWLRAKGLAKAAKKADRVAAEGLIGVAVAGTKGAAVEVNSETDFVARNEEFQAMVSAIAEIALSTGVDVDALAAAAYPGAGKSVAERITDAVAKIGENMSLRRVETISVGEGAIGWYVHNAAATGLGRLGILVGLESSAGSATLEALGKQIAMHIAATNPMAVRPEEIDADVVAREKAVFSEQAAASGKPAEIVEKMVEGRMRKFYEEVCLLSQAFVINPDQTVQQAIDEAAKTAGTPISVTGFVRLALGEGVEKQESDFAAEVAAAAGSK